MKFAKQRALIFASLVMIPVSATLALLQTPLMSDLLLGATLRFARFRTGVRIEANGWKVNPFTFSATLEGLGLRHERLVLTAPEVWVQFSPLGLALGQLHLRDLQLRDPLLKGRIPKEWLETTPDDPDAPKPWTKDLPTWLGRQLSLAVGDLDRHHFSMDNASIRGLRVEAAPLKADRLDVEVTNFELGQARVRWNVEGFEWSGKVGRIASFAGAVGLMRESAETYYLTLASLRASLVATESSELPDLKIDGRFPGQLNVDARIQGEALRAWLASSPALVDPKDRVRIGGSLEAKARVRLAKDRVISSEGQVSARDLHYDGYELASLETRFESDAARSVLRGLDIRLPKFPGDRVATGGRIRSDLVTLESKRLKAVLELEKTSVCSIQLAVDSKDCYSAVSVDGSVAAEGTLDPFDLKATVKSKLVGESFVSSEPLYGTPPELAPVVRVGPSDFEAQVHIRSKFLTIEPGVLSRADGMSIRTEGRIDFNPTIVDLKSVGTKMPLGTFPSEIAGFNWGGQAEATAHIQYHETWPLETGRSRVVARLEAKGLEFEGQRLGDASGPFSYAGDSFRIGPLLLRSGGGSAEVEGNIRLPASSPTQMTLKGKFSRLEVVGRAAKDGPEAFRGLVSGQAEISGGIDAKSRGDFLSGPIQLGFDAARIFGIPFESGTVRGRYDKGILHLTQARALKGRASVSVQGLLHPEGGSELVFRSEDFPLRDTELHPFLASLEGGRSSFEGFWRPQEGWGVSGRLRDMKIAGTALPDGEFSVRGTDTKFRLETKLPSAADFRYVDEKIGNRTRLESLKGSVEGVGLYAGLAYLKGWKEASRVRTQGKVDFDIAEDEGEIRFGPLEINGPVGVEGRDALLAKFDAGQVIAWRKGLVREVRVVAAEPEPWSLRASPGDRQARLEGRLPAPFVDLFIPAIGLREGRLIVEGTVPMPPDIATLDLRGSLESGVVMIDALGAPMTGVSAQLGLEKGRLSLREATGRMGPGDVTLSGAYKFDALKPGLALSARFNRARAILMKDLPLEASGEIVIAGEGMPWSLSGEIVAQNGLYSREFGLDDVEGGAPRDPFFKLNVGVEVGGRFAARNSLVSSEVLGRLNVTGTDVAPVLRGKLDLAPNGILYARDNEFRVARGNVVFTGAPGNVPVVSLEANTTIKADRDYTVQLGVSGPTDRLDFTFNSDPVLPTQEIVMLLAFGYTRPDESLEATSEEGIIRNAQWQALQLLFGQSLGKSLDRRTGFQVRVQNQQSASSQSGRTTVPKVTVHRKLTDRISAVYGKALDGSQEQDLQVDYRLFRNVNISGVWEEPEPTKSSLGVDLRFKFDVK